MSSKTCSQCKQNKPFDQFYISQRRSDGRQHRCKECSRVYTQEATQQWRKINSAASCASNKKTKLKMKYGLLQHDIEKLLEEQNGLCAICSTPISYSASSKKATPHIDHDHETGIVRGLLCLTCNTGIGMFGDSILLLDQAKAYLLQSISGQRERLSELAPLGRCDSPLLQEK